ncbi:MAG TPA: molecular chaperone HscC [Spirochaetota bacterium]|nr:molecular chaperone HscC [Spirochaetota bacterium]
MPIVGIDLGTTNSLISYWKEDRSVIIPNAFGGTMTPSVVGLDDNGEILVGGIAKERLLTYPERTVSGFKRFMGSNKSIVLGDRGFLPEELSSLVIRSLVGDAEACLGQRIEEAVISVPAYFSDAQRKATKRAGELAGLRVERIINEPTAAATAYGLHQKESETKFLVLDLGGGTFDVSIIEFFENVLEVRAIAGDNRLGGEDFTDCLAASFMEIHGIAGFGPGTREYAHIRKQAEIGKRVLSSNSHSSIQCLIGGNSYGFEIDIEHFTKISQPLLKRLRHPIERALKDSGLRPDDLDEIIMVGGASRMPVVHSLVKGMFGRDPSYHLNPDEVVASGAGIQAALKGRDEFLKEVILTDVCPYSLGTDIAVGDKSGFFSPIIERNTVIPVSRVERYYTADDNQTSIPVGIYQGEARLVKNNICLGELSVDVPPAPAGEQTVDVRFTYDINGILEVEVMVVETGAKKRMILEESPGSMSREEIERRLASLADLKIHPRDKQENRMLLVRGERMYEESLGVERDQVAEIIREFEIVLERQNPREIAKAAKECGEKLDELDRWSGLY